MNKELRPLHRASDPTMKSRQTAPCPVQERALHLLAVASLLASLPTAGAFVMYRRRDPRSLTWNSSGRSCDSREARRQSFDVSLAESIATDDSILSDMVEHVNPFYEKLRTTLRESPSLGHEGLSKFHQSILSRSTERQRLVTGKDPLRITVEDNPTRRWLALGRERNAATAHLLVNGTTIERSAASFDRFQWIDDDERHELHERYAMVSLELIAEVHVKKPGYVNVLPSVGAGSTAALRRAVEASTAWNRYTGNSVLFDEIEGNKPPNDRLWVSGFSLASQQGYLHSVDAESGHIQSVDSRTSKVILWPNEFNSVPIMHLDGDGWQTRTKVIDVDAKEKCLNDDALLVCDGFLVPGKNKGGIYVVKNPGNSATEWTSCLAGGVSKNHAWFYHRAVWVDLTGDGRKSILTARAKSPSLLKNGKSIAQNGQEKGQLVWLEMPKPYSIDDATGTPLEEDGTVFDPFNKRHTPWKEHVLDEGPDVMFAVADLDTEDGSIEVIASQFFNKKVSLCSIERGPIPRITFRRIIDDKCGSAFAAILANLDGLDFPTMAERIVVDSGSTVDTCKPGDAFSHVLVTSHECSFDSDSSNVSENELSDGAVDGGSLFSYRVPDGRGAWKTEPWIRTTVASGFRVKGQLGNMINPGAPGFVYTFYPRKDMAGPGKRPLIAIAGDCAESAYLLRPIDHVDDTMVGSLDANARYKLMCEIECGATVGSIAVGYDDFCAAEQQSGYAKLYIPCYEKDKVLVFAMGDGDEDVETNGW